LTKHKLISKEQRHLLWIDYLAKEIRLDDLESKKFVKKLKQEKIKND
jgi:hypothetical protein